MVVVGYKVQKLSASKPGKPGKAALWVRFTSPPEYVGKTIQMYPKSLEPKKGPACGADFSLVRAIADSHPHATTLRDLSITSSTSAAFTSTLQKPRDSMTAAFDDNGTSDDMDIALQLDFPVFPPQQSLDDLFSASVMQPQAMLGHWLETQKDESHDIQNQGEDFFNPIDPTTWQE
jgi:hypothetical protein